MKFNMNFKTMILVFVILLFSYILLTNAFPNIEGMKEGADEGSEDEVKDEVKDEDEGEGEGEDEGEGEEEKEMSDADKQLAELEKMLGSK